MANSDQWRIPGGVYHVMNRGNRKCPIFEDDRDRKRFVRLLIEAAIKHRVEVQIGTQMVTHFHLTVCTPDGNLPDFMQELEGPFARYSNWRHGRVGHLFQGPFRRVLIESDLQLFIVAAYIFGNPVVGKYVDRPEQWKWSTYAATVGLAPTPSYLSTSWVQALFPSDSLDASRSILKRCIDAPDQILAYLQADDPETEAAVRSYIAERRHLIDQPCPFGMLIRPPLVELFKTNQTRLEVAIAIRQAHEKHGYKLAEIARHLGIHRATASKMYRSRLGVVGPVVKNARRR
jgi:hypothetical protein